MGPLLLTAELSGVMISPMVGRIGILTGGGDCPGLNAAIRAVVRKAACDQKEVLGIYNGWKGLVENDVRVLTRDTIVGILPLGGTILGTSRLNPLETQERVDLILENWKRNLIDSLIVIGGEGTLAAAYEMHKQYGLAIIGVPKTIDNDLRGTDFTCGFDTAVGVVTEAIDRLHSTAASHHRVMVVEVMGRHSGWIAAYGGIAGGADVILVPEVPFKISEVCRLLESRKERGRAFSIIIVAEDAHPHVDESFLTKENEAEIFRHERLGGIGTLLAHEIERLTGIETRTVKLGYVQRGGAPTAFDRILATRLGVKAYELVAAGEAGLMAAIQGNRTCSVPLEQAVGELKHLDPEIYKIAELFFG
jgi:ATP-dependent phosphofructokinase / diphosphate-dependent phosphofructokinase